MYRAGSSAAGINKRTPRLSILSHRYICPPDKTIVFTESHPEIQDSHLIFCTELAAQIRAAVQYSKVKGCRSTTSAVCQTLSRAGCQTRMCPLLTCSLRIRIYIYIYIYTCIYICLCIHIYKCIHLNVYIYVYTYTCINIFLYIYQLPCGHSPGRAAAKGFSEAMDETQKVCLRVLAKSPSS